MLAQSKYGIYFKLHFIIFLWGFTGILGTLITIDSSLIVMYRMAIAFASIAIFLLVTKQSLKIKKKHLWQIFLTGIIIALHWITFFESLKISNVSVTLACLSSSSLFTAFLEPIFFRRRIVLYEICFGLMIIVGLFVIFRFETQYSEGIILSVTSAFFAALFTVINGKLVAKEDAKNITMYEMLAGTISIVIYLLVSEGIDSIEQIPTNVDWFYILLLGIICTAYAFVVNVALMKRLSPFTVTIAVNMEPIYAIIMALIFFGDSEYMSGGFYVGAIIIMSTIFGHTFIKSKSDKMAETA